MKTFIKKLNNFRFTSVLLSAISTLSGIISILLLVFYYLAGDISKKTESRIPAFANLGQYGKIIGMFYFLFLITIIGLAIAVVYFSIPAILNKEKITPKRSTSMLCFVSACFQLVILVLTILELVLENPHTLVGFIVCIPFLIISIVAHAMALIPFFRCDFYMPEIKR